ncbi:AAA family ATPase [Deferribacter autotrophicus]|uniref:Replication-associated recombination protein A n=1 Tax=Deferribacter autotrophicus TaxID=500465 RepID=A0A5A8F5S0_9BACT|nr:AAA family ATPase [Deferribacter autotrophicus]KAA0257008.1 AAA family ATPase [Deferribacter autotrophicus]
MKILEALKPEKFEDIIGQDHLTGENTLFRRVVERGDFASLILIGPPGSGKTSIASIIGKYHSLNFYRLHAANSSAADIRRIVEETKGFGRQSIVFIDEIHHYSKSQQNLLLNIIDEQYIKLIGASTENPYYNLIPPLRSRSLLFNLNKPDRGTLEKIFQKGVSWVKKEFAVKDVKVEDEFVESLLETADGDIRRLLIFVENSALIAERVDGVLIFDRKVLDRLPYNFRYSKDEHYHALSAMIKSIRGSDPDAALLWCLKLLKSGVDPRVIFRRLLISASEDIGNAMPDALVVANAAYEAFEKVGLPEGKIIMSQLVTYLASCPKSNRSYIAVKECEKFLEKNNPIPPDHLRSDSKKYKYPFDYGGFVKQAYCDENILFYKPLKVGFESKFLERLKRLWGTEKYEQE